MIQARPGFCKEGSIEAVEDETHAPKKGKVQEEELDSCRAAGERGRSQAG